MSNLQTSLSTNNAKTLANTIRPYQILHTLKWENLLNKKQREGWIECFVQGYLTTSRSAQTIFTFAAEQAALRRDEDLTRFINWARTHAQEEKEHHKWYLDDLVAMGFRRSELENLIAGDIALEVLGVQFALISTAHPVSVLGYVFVLECYTHEPATIYELARRFSIPDEGLRTILYHVEEDQKHRQPIVELIDFYSKNEFLYGAILKSAVTTLVGWTKFLTKLAQ
ncbi:iron-containing redox enzyme family protein [Trichocoleus sp. ST-U3]